MKIEATRQKELTDINDACILTGVKHSNIINKSLKFFPNSELKVKTYETFRPYFDRTSSVNDMNVKKMNFKKGFFFNASWGLELSLSLFNAGLTPVS